MRPATRTAGLQYSNQDLEENRNKFGRVGSRHSYRHLPTSQSFLITHGGILHFYNLLKGLRIICCTFRISVTYERVCDLPLATNPSNFEETASTVFSITNKVKPHEAYVSGMLVSMLQYATGYGITLYYSVGIFCPVCATVIPTACRRSCMCLYPGTRPVRGYQQLRLALK